VFAIHQKQLPEESLSHPAVAVARVSLPVAWPVWGCNPLLAGARACANHVYLVSSTYEDAARNWMTSAVEYTSPGGKAVQ